MKKQATPKTTDFSEPRMCCAPAVTDYFSARAGCDELSQLPSDLARAFQTFARGLEDGAMSSEVRLTASRCSRPRLVAPSPLDRDPPLAFARSSTARSGPPACLARRSSVHLSPPGSPRAARSPHAVSSPRAQAPKPEATAAAPAAPEPKVVTTELIQKYLDENQQLILAILENQNVGKLAECARYQARLQQNLMYLAAIADAQPSQGKQ